jgi:hypothetical protein
LRKPYEGEEDPEVDGQRVGEKRTGGASAVVAGDGGGITRGDCRTCACKLTTVDFLKDSIQDGLTMMIIVRQIA